VYVSAHDANSSSRCGILTEKYGLRQKTGKLDSQIGAAKQERPKQSHQPTRVLIIVFALNYRGGRTGVVYVECHGLNPLSTATQ
jgi:hypothetical protein